MAEPDYGAPIWRGINQTYRNSLVDIIKHDTEQGCLQEPWVNFQELGQATSTPPGTAYSYCVQSDVQQQWIDLAVDNPGHCAVPV